MVRRIPLIFSNRNNLIGEEAHEIIINERKGIHGLTACSLCQPGYSAEKKTWGKLFLNWLCMYELD